MNNEQKTANQTSLTGIAGCPLTGIADKYIIKTASELIDDFDTDSIIVSHQMNLLIVFDFEKVVRTATGNFTITKNSLLVSILNAANRLETILVVDNRAYTVNVDTGLLVFAHWDENDDDCWPTITAIHDMSQVPTLEEIISHYYANKYASKEAIAAAISMILADDRIDYDMADCILSQITDMLHFNNIVE